MLSSRLFPLFPCFSVVDTRSVDRRLLRVRICKFVTHPDGNKAICQWQTNWYRFSEIIIRVYPLYPRRWYIIWLFFVEVSINTRRSQNLKDGHLTNAKNQILVISENCMGRHLPKAKRVTLGMSKKWTKMHRIERDPWCLGWTHVTITCFSQLAKDQVVQ